MGLIVLLTLFVLMQTAFPAQQPNAPPPSAAITTGAETTGALTNEAPEGELPVFRSGVALVPLDVQVIEKGVTVTGLTADDFIIYDEGAKTPIVYFGRDTEPIHLLLLLDISGSMRRYLEQLAETSRKALSYLKKGDKVGIMLFARRTEIFEDFTQDFSKASDRIKDVLSERGLGSGTAINAAILASTAQFGDLEPDPLARRSIVILTDNQGTNYQLPDSEVIDALLETGAVLNAIVVGKARRPGENDLFRNPDFSPADVYTLAEKTGGEVESAKDAGRTFAEMIERLRSRYSLHFRAAEAPAGTYRQVRVDLTPQARKRHPKAEIKARSGYKVSQY